MPYTLITVTYGGTVSHSRGYETLRMCQEARSIALYGMTIAEKEEADRRYVEMQQREAERIQREREARDVKLRAAWSAKHPGRAPTPEEAQDIRRGVLEWAHDPYDTGAVRERVKTCEMWGDDLALDKSRLAADGLIYDDFKVVGSIAYGIPVASRSGFWVCDDDPRTMKGSNDIKSAHCVIEMPDAPVQDNEIAAHLSRWHHTALGVVVGGGS